MRLPLVFIHSVHSFAALVQDGQSRRDDFP